MCSEKSLKAPLLWKAVRIQTPLRREHTSWQNLCQRRRCLVVWLEASMACGWLVLSMLRSKPDLYCILLSSQASYMTHLNFKETFVDFNLSLQKYMLRKKVNMKKKTFIWLGFNFRLTVEDQVTWHKTINQTIKHKYSSVEEVLEVTSSHVWLFYAKISPFLKEKHDTIPQGVHI